MSLQFELLLGNLDLMARAAVQRHQNRQERIQLLLDSLEKHATEWSVVEAALQRAGDLSDPKHYRSARPLDQEEPLNASIDPPALPGEATLIAIDGSQIMPDRHATQLYYLINIGGIVYRYRKAGEPARSPEPFTIPELVYPRDPEEELAFAYGGSDINVKRDLKEIGTLADKAWEHRGEPLLFSVLDQRLLYWPIGGPEASPNEDIVQWLAAMTRLRDSGSLMAGYIDRPMTGAVATMLYGLTGLDDPDFDWKSLGKQSGGMGLHDATLFAQILGPGQRSKVFAFMSPPNRRFAEYDPANEVCFFYFNPGPSAGDIARVDIPIWVAEDSAAVGMVHALVHDQCQILGGYPYVLARADEMAVIGRRDHEELNFMIDLHMQRHGIEGRLTTKQASKLWARSGKTRHGS